MAEPTREHVRALGRCDGGPSAEAARVLLISPVHNEAAHIEQVAMALAAQTRRPDLWLVVEDNSTDETPTLLRQLQGSLDFMQVTSTPAGHTTDGRDRLAAGAAYRAFNWGMESIPWRAYTHIGKLDGDIVLPPDYLERILEKFSEDPRLGMAGGVITELVSGQWCVLPTPPDQAIATARIYSRECLEAIGGVPARPAADPIAGIYARMRGFQTKSFPELPVRHMRRMGAAGGLLRARARHGEQQYTLHYGFGWALLRSGLVAVRQPRRGLSGLAYLYGYLRGAVTRRPRVADPEFRAFVRRELRSRARRRGPGGMVSRPSRRRHGH